MTTVLIYFVPQMPNRAQKSLFNAPVRILSRLHSLNIVVHVSDCVVQKGNQVVRFGVFVFFV